MLGTPASDPPKRPEGRAERTGTAALPDRPSLGIVVGECGDIQPGEEGAKIVELAEAGMDFYTFRAEWDRLRSDPEMMGLIQWAIPWAKSLGMQVMLTIPTLDTTRRTMPDDLLTLPMDDPRVLARFDQLLADLITPEVATTLDYVSIGNEVDGYLGAHPEELPAFRSFTNHAYATLRQLGVTAPTCVTLMVPAVLADDTSVADTLLEPCSVVPLTYYPQDPGFQFRDPSTVPAELNRVLSAAGTKPIVFQEIGYASDSANNGSEARQRAFLEAALTTLAFHRDRVLAVNINWYCDIPRSEAESLAQDLYEYAPNDPGYDAFVGFLASLGLKREDGTAKLAYQTFLDVIAAPSK
jgi:hypothetical protein